MRPSRSCRTQCIERHCMHFLCTIVHHTPTLPLLHLLCSNLLLKHKWLFLPSLRFVCLYFIERTFLLCLACTYSICSVSFRMQSGGKEFASICIQSACAIIFVFFRFPELSAGEIYFRLLRVHQAQHKSY